MIAVLLLALAIPATRPTAAFTVKCDKVQVLRCTFNGSSSKPGTTGSIFDWKYEWGDGRSESHARATVTNTWARPGTYCVKLTVTDSLGQQSLSTKLLTLPWTGAALRACPKAPTTPPPGRVDTVIIRPPPVHDTTIVRVPVPGRVDTVVIRPPARVDTLQLPGRIDTVSTALPILPPGIVIMDPAGERVVYWNTQRLGRLVFDSDGVTVWAYRETKRGAQVQSNYPTQLQAIAALLGPPPPGWVP